MAGNFAMVDTIVGQKVSAAAQSVRQVAAFDYLCRFQKANKTTNEARRGGGRQGRAEAGQPKEFCKKTKCHFWLLSGLSIVYELLSKARTVAFCGKN